jgi:hypothetical protein
MSKYIRADFIGPVCAGWCEHESCLVIACPDLFRVAARRGLAARDAE